MSIREDFFTALSKGAKWDVGVSIARTNPLPLDANSVFKSFADLETYCGGVLAYVGQPVAVVEENKTTLYVLDQNKVPQPVGTATEGDGKTIELTEDGILRIYGTGEAVEVGAQLVMGDGGKVKWVKPDTTTVEGLSSAVETLTQSVSGIDGRVTTAEGEIDTIQSDIADLEAKWASMGGIFNFAGSKTEEEFANIAASDYDAGDVILVGGTKEYVCVEIPNTEGEGSFKRWEILGDPSGVAALQAVIGKEATGTAGAEDYEPATGLIGDIRDAEVAIAALQSKDTEISGKITSLEAKDTELANAIQEKAAQADLEAAVSRIGVNETAIGALETKDSELESAIALKAGTQYVDNKVTELTGKIDNKADADVVAGLVANSATKSELTEGLSAKVNVSDYNSKIAALESADTKHTEDISAARQIADKNKTDIEGINTALASKAAASDVTALTGRVGTAETTISGHTASINSLNGTVSTLEQNKAEKSAVEALTNRVKANEDAISAHADAYAALLNRVNGHDTAIEKAQTDATQALADAATAQSAAEAAQAKGEEGLAKANAVLGAETDEATAYTVYGAKKAAAAADAKAVAAQGAVDTLAGTVNGIDAAYKSADEALGKRIDDIDAVIGGVQGAMHFIGVSTVDPSTGVVAIEGKDDYVAANGDVVIYESKEYVYSNNSWVELGDVSEEAQRIGGLEQRMTTAEVETAKVPGLVTGVAANASAIEALTTRVKANEDYKTTNDAALAALAGRVQANETAIAKEIADRDAAVKAEASARATAIAGEASARETAVNELQGQINDVVAKLTWTKLG